MISRKKQLNLVSAQVIGLFLEAFPREWDTKAKRDLCRRFQDQVTEPLMKATESPSLNAGIALLVVGTFLLKDGKLKDAERLQSRGVSVRLEILGKEHPDTLTSMNNLALTYSNQGKLQEAADLQEKVLEARRRRLGEEHPDTLTSMDNLASTYWNQGKLQEAADLQEKVLEARRRMLGEEHPDTLTSMNNLASTYWNQGKIRRRRICKRRCWRQGGECWARSILTH